MLVAPTITMVDVFLTIEFDDWQKEIKRNIYNADDPTDVHGLVEPEIKKDAASRKR